ncbi:MAG: hypothetical protein KF763_15245 [Cyclobacteriaceae bacterium]|nr:hypothetical protein [Cyclobacteriaceae bacterium]
MEILLQEILFLLRNEECPHESVKIKLMNLIETLSIGSPNPVQQAQIESLTSFPTAIHELIILIKESINNSICSLKEKTDLFALLAKFEELIDEK